MTEHEKLVDDLGRVLESDDFQFPGYPIHFASHTTWTNPCLSIPGLGLIGLPLSHRDAELIKASEWTSYNNNIWTINADHIVFENPSWEDAVRSVTSDVQSELGMDSSGKALEYRLDKLLLFGPGSENQSTTIPVQPGVEQASLGTPCPDGDGTVANMLISLPSKYKGGEIELSPYLRTETFDSSSCLASTCFWAWYPDVLCNVRPIKSGHRLMLLYKIVTTSSAKSSVFPDMTSGVEALRSIFQKWHRREYREIPKFRYVFYNLKHEYSIQEIEERRIALRGEDAHKAACLQSATIKMGYKICLARFQRHRLGNSSTVNEVLYLFDINTREDQVESRMMIQADSIISSSEPKRAVSSESALGYENFTSDDESSDDEEETLRYGLFVYHEDDEGIALIGSQGFQNMCCHLENSLSSSNMTEKEAMMVRYMMQNFKAQIRSRIKPWSSNNLEVLTDYALTCENFAVWKDAIAMGQYSLTGGNMDKFLRATRLFGFDRVKKSLQRAIDYANNSRSVKVDFLCKLSHTFLCPIARESLKTVVKWCKDNIGTLMAKRPLLRLFGDLDELIHVLTNVSRTFGMEFLVTINLGTIEDMPTFIDFLSKHHRTVLPSDEEKVTKHLLDLCFDVVVRDLTNNDYDLWQKAYSDKTEYLTGATNDKQIVIIGAFSRAFFACLMRQQVERCEKLSRVALDSRGCTYTKVVQFYTPVINLFCTFMDKPIIRAMIWEYLGAMLGTRSINPRLPPRRIGRCSRCQCKHCVRLDAFMLQPHIRIVRFENLKMSEMNHIRLVAHKGRDLVTYTFPSPHKAEVTKLPHVLAGARWEGRVAEAGEFLNSIGTKEAIEKIMGSDYGELQKAMKGEYTVKLRKWSPEEIEQRNSDLRKHEEALQSEERRRPGNVFSG